MSKKRRPAAKKTHRKNFRKTRSGNVDRKFYSKEDIFLSRIASILQVSKNETKHIFCQRARTTIRLNPLKGNTQRTYKSLDSKGWQLQKISGFSQTYFVNNKDKKELIR